MKNLPAVCLAVHSLDPGKGGVARMARLVAKALSEEARRGTLAVHGFTLADSRPTEEFGFPVRTARDSRVRFVAMVHSAALHCSHFVYDSCNMAQAHPRIPLLRRPNLTMLAGVEVWEDAKPRWLAACRRSSILAAISNHTQTRAEALHGGFARAIVCPLSTEMGASPEETCPKRRLTRPEALIVSRIEASEDYKGHRELIDCWPSVVERVPEAVLHIVGRGSGLEAIQRRAAESTARDRIVFHGFVTDEELERRYEEARLFVMPSRGEGFGLVYTEAMRKAVPVICSTHDSGKEIVVDGETGFAVNLDRPEELPDRLAILLGDQEKADAMGRAGYELWKRAFTFDVFRERFRPILNELLRM